MNRKDKALAVAATVVIVLVLLSALSPAQGAVLVVAGLALLTATRKRLP